MARNSSATVTPITPKSSALDELEALAPEVAELTRTSPEATEIRRQAEQLIREKIGMTIGRVTTERRNIGRTLERAAALAALEHELPDLIAQAEGAIGRISELLTIAAKAQPGIDRRGITHEHSSIGSGVNAVLQLATKARETLGALGATVRMAARGAERDVVGVPARIAALKALVAETRQRQDELRSAL